MAVEIILYPDVPLPPDAILKRLQLLSTSLISDVAQRSAGASRLMPLAGLKSGSVVVGAALTVKTRDGDNLAVHQALEYARSGEILVVAAGGSKQRAIVGGLMGQYAQSKGVVALVVDGAIRDVTELDAMGLPTFGRAITHLGPYKDGPGEIRGAVAICGAVVNQGDVIVGDANGIAIIPRARLCEITQLAESQARIETAAMAAIESGTWDRSWLRKLVTVRRIEDSGPVEQE